MYHMASHRPAEFRMRAPVDYGRDLGVVQNGDNYGEREGRRSMGWDDQWGIVRNGGHSLSTGLGNGDMKDEHYRWLGGEFHDNQMLPATRTYMRPQMDHTSSHNRQTSFPPSSSSSSYYHHHHHLSDRQSQSASTTNLLVTSEPHASLNSRSTLWWGDLEPWMDEQYAKQVCTLMGWDGGNNGAVDGSDGGVTVKIPQLNPGAPPGSQPNNPGYCFLTFPSSQHAASVLARLNNNGSEKPLLMPNSSRPFNLNWASIHAPASVTQIPQNIPSPNNSVSHISNVSNNSSSPASTRGGPAPALAQKEHSIFVGDLAPEASNSDLLAVFRNPILGLRSDRAPKCVRPFYSCKSAKIMLDPVTGVSKGYGFVRFTDQAEQQRALMEMHGLYCLSRPMRVSPATAKYKPASPPLQSPTSASNGSGSYMSSLPSLTLGSAASVSSSESRNSFNNNSFDMAPPAGDTNVSISTPLANGESTPSLSHPGPEPAKPDVSFLSRMSGAPTTVSAPVILDDESWNSPANAQARALLASLTGAGGEQLSSTDPYNTTVFVGGLSPLISEDTLRTFFAPFGDIHYVKVPVGKHCGFVQFVKKVDASRAIEKMQAFPIGGSRIRLSWGRSQYKAAQAVVQQAQQQAFIQSQPSYPQVPESEAVAPIVNQPVTATLTPEQALELLQAYGYSGFVANNARSGSGTPADRSLSNITHNGQGNSSFEQGTSEMNGHPSANGFGQFNEDSFAPNMFSPFEHQHKRSDGSSNFSPSTSGTNFNRAPGFGSSNSLSSMSRVSPSQSGGAVNNSPPGSFAPHNIFNPADMNSFSSQFYEGPGGSSRAQYLHVSDMLRRDSHILPRSHSNMSSHKSDRDALSPSPSSFAQAHAGENGYHNGAEEGRGEDDIQDMNGMLKSLNLDPKVGRVIGKAAEHEEGELPAGLARTISPRISAIVGDMN